MRELGQLGWKRIRQRLELLEQSKERRYLRALRPVFDLDRDSDSALRQQRAMHTLGANLRHDSTVRLGDQRGIESIRSSDEEWVVNPKNKGVRYTGEKLKKKVGKTGAK